MTDINKNTQAGDAAVDGLLAGIGAGFLMAAYLAITGLLSGSGLAETLSLFAPFGPASPLLGALAHLAVSAIYGVLFGLLFTPFRRRLPVWIAGAIFGLLLFIIARIALLPGTNSPLASLAPVNLAAAHLVYGLALGWMVGKKEANLA